MAGYDSSIVEPGLNVPFVLAQLFILPFYFFYFLLMKFCTKFRRLYSRKNNSWCLSVSITVRDWELAIAIADELQLSPSRLDAQRVAPRGRPTSTHLQVFLWHAVTFLLLVVFPFSFLASTASFIFFGFRLEVFSLDYLFCRTFLFS